MISKKGLVIGIIGAAVITAGILLAKSNVFKGGNKNDEKHRHQQTQLRIAQAEIADEQWEQRRQQQVKKV